MSETFFITTPCLNARATIDRTILSVVTQSGNFNIRYHIQDAGSTDGTVERLKWWRRRLQSKGFPLRCNLLEFSFSSEPDAGMYDGLCKGFEAMHIASNDFMTWINADDILMPGALAFMANVAQQFSPQQVSWVSGANSIIRDETPIVNTYNPVPKAALVAGLCDGVHWNFLQQEGTFFRKWMWTSIEPKKNVAALKLAGDWNLWRLLATKASLVQTKFALASFCITEGQLSARLREEYITEINSIVPEKQRRQALKDMAHPKADIRRRLFKVNYGDARLTIYDEGSNGLALLNSRKIFGDAAPNIPNNLDKTYVIAEGNISEPADQNQLSDVVSFENNIAAYDRDWQFPAITEQQAFHQMRDTGGVPDNVTYIAYPWANLIDKLQTKAPDAIWHMKKFQKFCDQLPQGTVRVTTCQHIKMRQFMHLFEKAGISHIFWTHATHNEALEQDSDGFAIHPFPLFPVQIPEADTLMPITKRPYLFSFIGAKSNQYYLTRAREWILDLLPDHPKGLIIGRDNWHYNKVVYEHQIRPGAKAGGNAADLVDKSASEQFKISMAQSVFSLCPSGSGPNSIRLWETLGAGAIPVILADTYAPPGDPALWEAGAVFCKEDPEAIKALPARLEEIAADPERLRAMRQIGQQLWTLYGPQSFVYDVQKLMLRLAQGQTAQTAGAMASSQLFRDTLVARMNTARDMTKKDAQMLLRVCSSDLLLEGSSFLNTLQNDGTVLGELVELAQDTLPDTHPTLQHFQNVSKYVATQMKRPQPVSPAISASTGPKICFFGRHSNRTPLSYPSFQRALGNRISVVDTPEQADIVMTGFNIDLRDNPDIFEKITKEQPDTKIMVVSEEPLWDSLWAGGFVSRNRKIKCGNTNVSYTFLNHSNSDIFTFDQIPYFLLTEDDLLARYNLLIRRNCQLSSKDLLSRWNNAPISAAFVAEKREGDKYDKPYPEHAVFGLSSYRSEVAAKTKGKDVLREGKGWHSDKPRQDLPDWHLDKIASLDGRVRVMSSFENTHQHNYISEKIMDAFVVGGIPTYYADEKHSITKLVPESCMINTFGKSSDQAARQIAGIKPDLAMAEAWLETARGLHKRFSDPAAISAERNRVAKAALKEIEAL